MFPLNKTPHSTYGESSVASCSHVFLPAAVFQSDVSVCRNVRLPTVPDLFLFGRQTVAEVERWPVLGYLRGPERVEVYLSVVCTPL